MVFLVTVGIFFPKKWIRGTDRPRPRGLLGALVYAAAIIMVPADEPVDPDGRADWIGAYLGAAARILFNFVWK